MSVFLMSYVTSGYRIHLSASQSNKLLKRRHHICHSRALEEIRLCIWSHSQSTWHVLRKWDFLPPREHTAHMLLCSLEKSEGSAWGSLKARNHKTGCGSDWLAQDTVIHYEGQEREDYSEWWCGLLSVFIVYLCIRQHKRNKRSVRRDLF